MFCMGASLTQRGTDGWIDFKANFWTRIGLMIFENKLVKVVHPSSGSRILKSHISDIWRCAVGIGLVGFPRS